MFGDPELNASPCASHEILRLICAVASNVPWITKSYVEVVRRGSTPQL